MKDYYFRASTIAADVTAHGSVFGRYVEDTSLLCTATLLPGDFLYLPARWLGMAACFETSLSISVGVRPRAVAAVVTQPEPAPAAG